MSSLATVMATRRPKWQYPQPAPPTPRILHFPRRPRMRRRPSKSLPTKPTSDGRGKLEALFGQEREFLKESFPVVLMDPEREREGYGGGAAAAEEKWRFQAEMLRAECNLLRMEREITNKKLEKMKSRMERTLKSAVQALVSGRNKIYEGNDVKMVLEDEINDLAQKLERLRRGSRDKQIELKKSSNFDKQASLLQKKLEKIGEDTDELKTVAETKKTCRDQESFISNGKFNVDVLKRKMEDLSKGTLLERMREECRSMLSTPSASSVRSATLPNLDSTLSQEQNQCSGHCKAIIRRITEQVKAEKDQWSQMQEMLNQVREEMEELQVSREFWKDQALESESQIQSLQSSVEEWKEKAMAHEINKMKKKGQGSGSLPDEMEKHVLICRVKEKKNNHNLVLHARDVRSRRREISIDELQQEPQQQQQQQKLHTQMKTIEKIQRLPFREIGNHLHK
ncbi:centrosomal protein of 83 kDa isoform X2 [Cucumis sativus]|uniref:centrosomal protein of 83 kDa isoform X2 n=1 Tax=Cucumis sativus TaxID=3659 RepID=UPI0005EC0FA7|nr:centrosomal protein of 83 kDa isoform X2 [Cucumis sativus]